MPRPRVLLIEHDPSFADLMGKGLRTTGFTTEVVKDDVDGRRRTTQETFDAIVLDLRGPPHLGLKILASFLTSAPNTPLIVLTPEGARRQRVAALDAGAADALPKPVTIPELAARLRAQIRRARTGNVLSAAGIDIDLITGDVRRHGIPIYLSAKETALLAHLIRRRGAVCSRQEILTAVWGPRHPSGNVVETYVCYLRRKLTLPNHPLPLITIRGIGYRLTPD